MKTFLNVVAQGDVYIRRVEAMPQGVVRLVANDGKLVIAHSESGHSHVILLDNPAECAAPSVEMFSGDNPLIAWIRVNRRSVLEHHRPFDTHESIMFAPGIYEVRRQREHTPEGWRQVQD